MIVQKDLAVIQDRFIDISSKKTFTLEASFALQLINKSPQLQKCTRDSLIAAVMNVANFGLTLNPVKKEAFLVPRYDRMAGGMVAYLEPSYIGLIRAITETGAVDGVSAYCVFKGDDFSVELGTAPKINHKPSYSSKEITHVYAVAILKSGEKQIEVMSASEVDSIKKTSTSWRAFKEGKIHSCIWNDHESEMTRKTVVRRIVKYLPKGDNDKLSNLVAADETDYKPEFGNMMYAHSLIETSTLDHEDRARLDISIDSCTARELSVMIADLKNNQQPLSEIKNPSQVDIVNMINEKL